LVAQQAAKVAEMTEKHTHRNQKHHQYVYPFAKGLHI
jgi:hypothetical protein